MAESVLELINSLTENDRIVQELLQLLEEEQQNVAQLQGDRVEELAGRIRDLLGRLEAAASDIRRILARLAREAGLRDGATLSLIIPLLALPHRAVLEELRARLMERGELVNRLLEFNRELLSGGLQAVNNALDFFKSVMTTRRTTYGDQGKLLDGSNGVRLVNREA
ncbi:flagellar export chaperone FlgN [Geobacter argillaceus]|uniref:FlgN protein n=1 Tax=Geobacter argillaceus TaxID=345631 RepID=A0A562VJL0_9BACT|nr:flagellar export chaperone FlgN [Geobacter argillaceus]TWJ18058.1 FlgN protein [Geobacter argillaceus]